VKVSYGEVKNSSRNFLYAQFFTSRREEWAFSILEEWELCKPWIANEKVLHPNYPRIENGVKKL